MPMRRRTGLVAVALAALLGSPGCWVWVDSNPRQVEGKFAAAMEKVAELQAIPAGKRGKAHKVRVLVYDEGDDQLISVSAPMWLVKWVAEHAEEDMADQAGPQEGEAAGAGELARVKRHGWTLGQILEGGRGLMLQADEDGERILVWVE